MKSYREDVETARASTRRRSGGLSRPARGRRERLGFQLALVRRWRDARHDPHRRPAAAVDLNSLLFSTGADPVARVPRHSQSAESSAIRAAGAGAQAGDVTAICGMKRCGVFEDYDWRDRRAPAG